MTTITKDFLRRGIAAAGFGPLILAVVYLILQQSGTVEFLTVDEVCIGIVSLTALAFIAGGMNVIYQIERLPLMIAISIHGTVLYANDWLEWGMTPILVFSGIFILGYLAIWTVIYTITKKRTDKINAILKNKQDPAA